MGAFLKENWFKLGILVALLLIAWAIYTALVVEPEKKRADEQIKATIAQEAKDAQVAADATKQADTKKNLDACIQTASSNYFDEWYSECKSEGKVSNKCIDLHDLTFEQYLAKYSMTQTEYATQRNLFATSSLVSYFDYSGRWSSDECSCRLFLANSDRINQDLKDAKDECFKLNPQN